MKRGAGFGSLEEQEKKIQKKIVAGMLFHEIMSDGKIAHILFGFLDLRLVPSLGAVCKVTQAQYNLYIRHRAEIEKERLKALEREMQPLLKNIVKKRSLYFKTHNMTPPDKEHAISMLCEVTAKVRLWLNLFLF